MIYKEREWSYHNRKHILNTFCKFATSNHKLEPRWTLTGLELGRKTDLMTGFVGLTQAGRRETEQAGFVELGIKQSFCHLAFQMQRFILFLDRFDTRIYVLATSESLRYLSWSQESTAANLIGRDNYQFLYITRVIFGSYELVTS